MHDTELFISEKNDKCLHCTFIIIKLHMKSNNDYKFNIYWHSEK